LADYEEGTIVSTTVVDKKPASVAVYAFDKAVYAFDKFHGIIEHILPYDALFFVFEAEAEVHISEKPHTVKTAK